MQSKINEHNENYATIISIMYDYTESFLIWRTALTLLKCV